MAWTWEAVIVKDLRTNVARAITFFEQAIRALLIVTFIFIFIFILIISRPVVVFNVFIVVSK